MAGPKFDWNNFPTETSDGGVKPGASKFSWDQFPEEGSESRTPEEPGMLKSALEGVVSAAKKIDSYTGAPVRAGIGSLQDGKGVGSAISAAWSQAGEDPASAPTSSDIRKKAGIDLGDKKLVETKVGKAAGNFLDDNLISSTPTGWLAKKILENVSPNDVADFGIDVAADITNVIPVAQLGKTAGKAAAKGVGSAVRSAAKAIEGVENLAVKGSKRAIQGAFGVPEEAINNYLARHSTLKDKVGAREMAEELAGKLDEGLKPARDALASAENSVASAKSRRSEDLSELLVKRQEAKDALRLAEEQSLGEAASRVSNRVTQLDKEVSEGSAKAFEILDQEGIRVPTGKLKTDMSKGIAALEERAVTDEQVAVVDLLKRYRERLDKYGSEIPGGEAKRILQSIDREMKHIAPGEIGRMAKDDQALGVLRRRIDEPLKESQAYADQMKGVAADTRLLMDVRNLSSESAAARMLQAAGRSTGKDQADIIRALESKFGDQFLESVNRSNLPEYAKLKGMIQRYRAAKKGFGVKDAERGLEAASAKYGDVARLSENGVAGITDKINSYVRSSQPGAKQTELLEGAGEIAGIPMSQALKDTKTISAFEKGYNRGSANTNFWAAISGGVLGSVFGPGGAVGGAAMGGAFGRMVVDNFGPSVARKILDQAPMLKKVSPSEWIAKLDVPNSVKTALEKDLVDYSKIQSATRFGAAASKDSAGLKKVAEENELKGEDRWASQGAEKLGLKNSELTNKVMNSKEGKRLLIEASDLPPGSKKLQPILEKIQREWGKQYGSEPSTVSSPEVLRRERKPSSGR